MVSPFRITLWSRTFGRLGLLGDPQSVTLYPRHNQQPTAQIVLRSDHHLIDKILTPGSRFTIDYDGVQTISGVINRIDGTTDPGGEMTLQVRDDWCLLDDALGWPVPTSPIASQSGSEYDTIVGPAETVTKTVAARAFTRLGLPVTIAPDLGRGTNIKVKMRMNSLADKLFPLVDQAGIGVSIRQSGAGFVLDCYEPAIYPRTLTQRSGVISDAEWSLSAPAYTRVIVGGQGDGTARVFRRRINATAEAAWGVQREVFLEATDLDTTAELDDRGDEHLLEGAPTAGLKLTLAETDTVRYGKQIHVGDQVSLQITPGGTVITDLVREAVINWSIDDGLTAFPIVGERTDDPNRNVVKAIARIARQYRIQQTRK